MSMISSDRSASMNIVGIWVTNASRPASAPWNHAHARGIALARLMLFQISSWPISFMKPPITVSAAARHRFARDRVLAEHRDQEIPRGRALRELRERLEDRVLDQLEDPDDESDEEVDQLSDRSGEDLLRAVPDASRMEDVGPAERVDELLERVDEHAAGHAERRELLLDPRAALLEDAVLLERLDDQRAAGNELDDRAQDVRAGALDLGPVDRVDADDDREHAEARDVVRLVREPVENVADPPALHAGRRPLADGERAMRDDGGRRAVRLVLVAVGRGRSPQLHPRCAALLHDVRDLVRHQREVGRALADDRGRRAVRP